MAALTLANLGLSDADLRKRHPRIDKDRWAGVSSFTDAFEVAWADFNFDMRMRDWDMALILNTTANVTWCKQAVLFKTLRNIFSDWIGESGDVWEIQRNDYEKQYRAMIEDAKIEYDADESGDISDAEKDSQNQTVLAR